MTNRQARFGLSVYISTVLILLPLSALASVSVPPPLNFDPIPVDCENHLAPELTFILNKINIINSFSRYSTEKLPGGSGFILRNKNTTTPLRYITVPLSFNGDPWRKEDWLRGDQKFEFLQAGFKNLESEARLINRVVMNFDTYHRGENLEIMFSPEQAQARETLFRLRWGMHDAVVGKYLQTKNYLNESDFARMSWTNGWSDNSDVFGLFSGEGAVADAIVGVFDRLALSIQVTYFGRREFFDPSIGEALRSVGLGNFESEDRLPFEFRLAIAQRKSFAAKVYARFNRESTCEMMRYARFAADIPDVVHDRFLREAFTTAKKRGMKTILASTDALTARHFRRYGFRVFAVMPTTQNKKTEYLCYLEIESPEFRNLMRKFDLSAEQVVVTK